MGQGQSAASAGRSSGFSPRGTLFDLAMLAPYLLSATLSAAVALLVAKHDTDSKTRSGVLRCETSRSQT